jgi:hypothetical protein
MSARRLNVAGRSERTEAVTARASLLRLIGGISVLASAWVHYYLYFEGGYRDIAPDSFAGLTISRSFAINAIAGFVIAWALVVSVRLPRLAVPAAVLGVGFAAATLVAYLLSRTVGLLGFDDNQFNWEAVVALIVEVVALGSLGSWLALRWRARSASIRTA